MSVLRWGICTAGRISQDFCHAISGLESHKIQAIAARSKEDAERLGDEVEAEKTYGCYEYLATDPDIGTYILGSKDFRNTDCPPPPKKKNESDFQHQWFKNGCTIKTTEPNQMIFASFFSEDNVFIG